MALVIRDIQTRLFFRKGGWTYFPDFADRFKNQSEVEAEISNHGIKNVEMVILEGNSVVGGAPIQLHED